MIPAQNIVAWGNLVPWTDARQIEQDLIISRALVEIFSDPVLREACAHAEPGASAGGSGPGVARRYRMTSGRISTMSPMTAPRRTIRVRRP